MEKKLFLLDAYALIYRAYYAFIKTPRINSKGLNTSAIFGFVNTLDEILRKEKPSHIAVVFDPAGGTFRHQMYPEYKAQRPPSPEAIQLAVPYIKQILEGYRIPAIDVAGFEADDVIGTLAKKAEKEGFKVFMMTPDKDYCQLVSENIFIYKPKRSGNEVEIWGVNEVLQNFEIEKPSQVIDVLAMWGDASDNVPGLKGVGEKTAKDFVKRFGDLDGLYQNIHLLKDKQKQTVIENKDLVYLSKKLVTIVIDVPVEFDEVQLAVKEKDSDTLHAIFEDLEFKTASSRILHKEVEKKEVPPIRGGLFDVDDDFEVQAEELVVQKSDYQTIATVAHDYLLVDSPEKRKQLISQLSSVSSFCFDTETTSLDVHSAELVCITFSFKAKEGFCVPIPANQSIANEIVAEFKPIFENETIEKVGQNIKFDILMLRHYGVEVQGKLFDTMIAHYLLNPDLPHNLNHLAETYLNYSPVQIETLIGEKGKNQGNMRNVAIEKVKEYATEDADITWQLKSILEKEITDEGIEDLCYQVEMPLIYVLAEMEYNGINLDIKALQESAKVLEGEINAIETKVMQLAGFEFNLSSPKQLGEVLFERLKIIDNPKKTKTKQYSTSEPELQKLADKHEIIPLILEHRSLKKLLSTYVEALPLLIHSRTKKIHTSFNQAVTATGRLSSNHPNLQNIPIRTEKGREIRKAFIASNENFVLLSADYSQIELRLIAHLSQDETMISAFHSSADIHTATAAKIYSVSNEEVTREMRRNAKSANFGIVYGISAFGLAENLRIKRGEAKELIDGYFRTYPKVKEYMDSNIYFARSNRYVETIMKRKRHLTDIDSRNPMVRGIAERNAINAPVQGSAADIIKKAMVEIYKSFKTNNLKSKMLLQVHDELVFDVEISEIEKVKEIVKNGMENAVSLAVTLSVEMGTGENWLVAH